MVRRFPGWIRRPWASGDAFTETKAILDEHSVNTVCRSARCPNIGECWAQRTATFLLLGRVCTRNCRFCAVRRGIPMPVDPDEPARVAEAVRQLRLTHVVVTSVTRDDLPDGGASQFAVTVQAIRARCRKTTVEVLTPDFGGDRSAVETVIASGPDVFGHNIETVARLCARLRGHADGYGRALTVLREARALSPHMVVKSAIMVGLGETVEEVFQTLGDLLASGCEAVSVGQYLQPTGRHAPVTRYVRPEEFALYQEKAYQLGFRFAVAGPFVRSSYRAGELASVLCSRGNRLGMEDMGDAI